MSHLNSCLLTYRQIWHCYLKSYLLTWRRRVQRNSIWYTHMWILSIVKRLWLLQRLLCAEEIQQVGQEYMQKSSRFYPHKLDFWKKLRNRTQELMLFCKRNCCNNHLFLKKLRNFRCLLKKHLHLHFAQPALCSERTDFRWLSWRPSTLMVWRGGSSIGKHSSNLYKSKSN